MPIKVVFVLACMTGLMVGCQNSHGRTDDVLLKIGQYELPVADLELIRSSPQHKGLTEEQRLDKLITEGRILAYALDHRYDTIDLLNRQLDYAMQYHASSVDGYVWNLKAKPVLQVSVEDIRKAYAMRGQEYEVASIFFPGENLLKKYYKSNRPIQSVRDFNSLQARVKGEKDIQLYRGPLRYPFFPLGVYLPALAQGQPGDVWGPIEGSSGYYLIHLVDKRPTARRSIEQEQPGIHEELLLCLKEKIIRESQQQVLQETKPRFHDSAIAEIAAKVNVKERKWPGVPANLVLMGYDFGGTSRTYTLAGFSEFVQCQPMFTGLLSNADDVKKMLQAYLINISLYAQAQQMGMEKDTAWQLFRKRYRYGIFINHFNREHINPKTLEATYPVEINRIEEYLDQ